MKQGTAGEGKNDNNNGGSISLREFTRQQKEKFDAENAARLVPKQPEKDPRIGCLAGAWRIIWSLAHKK